jgi:hypothetical protein
VLTHAGSISAECRQGPRRGAFESLAGGAAQRCPEPVDVDFEAAIRETKAIDKARPRRKRPEEQ